MPLRDKLLENCTVQHGLSRNFFVARSAAQSRIQLYFSQQDCSNWQHHCTVYHPSSNLSRNFMAVLKRAHAHTSCFSFRGHIARQVAEKIAQCNRALNPKPWQLATLNFQPLRDKLLRKWRSVTGPLTNSTTWPMPNCAHSYQFISALTI